MRVLQRVAMAFCLLATVTAAGAFAQENEVLDPETVNFGIISTESTQALKKEFAPFLDSMEKAIGRPVKPFFAGDYAGVIEAMRFGKVHVAWFGNKSAIEAVDRSNGEVFAQMVGKGRNPGYHSLIITHKDSGLDSLDEVVKKGKELDFGNGDVNSTSGYLIPSYYLWAQKYNLDPKKHFKTCRNSSHGSNIMAVAMQQVDFSTNNTEQIKNFRREHPDKAKNIKILWKSPMIPKDPLVWRRDLDRELKAKIKAFVLSYGRLGPDAAKERQALAGISGGLDPFWDSSNQQLVPIREIKLAKAKMKIRNNEALSAADKKKQIAAVDTEIAKVRTFGDMLQKY